jgi:HlyD family secretion protein
MSRSAEGAEPTAAPAPASTGSSPALTTSPSAASPSAAATAPRTGWRALLTRRRVLLFSALVVAVLLIAGTGLVGGGGGAKDSPPVLVKREDLVVTVEVTGELAAIHAVELGVPPVRDMWEFKISFLAPESAQVKKGDPVVAFDTQALEKNLEEKSAEYDEACKQIERKSTDLAIQTDAQTLALAEAEAKLRKAEIKTDIPEDLKGRLEALEGRVEREEAEKEVANLRAKLESTKVAGAADLRALESRRDRAKGRVEDLRAAIEAMHVKAPQDGIVVYKSGRRDEKKKVGDPTWAMEKILELPDLSAMMAKGEVDEADAGRLAVGQKVTIRLEAHPDVDFKGSVRSIGRTVRRQSWRVPTKVYKLDIALDKTDTVAMRPAMRFRGDIETRRIPSVLVVPRDAIFLRPTGPVAWKKSGMSYSEVPVRLGRNNRRLVEVVGGLSEGDRISPVDLRPTPKRENAGPLAAGL